GDDLDFKDAVYIALSQVTNITGAFTSFDQKARNVNKDDFSIDSSRTLVRLNSPGYKKLGGGLRVKRIVTYDNWNAMSGQKESSYGQEYDYSIVKEIGGVRKRISSGVASYEPMIGSEENPFRQPIEYKEKIAPLGPVTMGYTEEPLGEAFFPSPSVGYSKVRVRTTNQNKRSANGYEETEFYTAYDFPTLTDRSMLDESNKKRYKPSLRNFLRIDAKHYITLSQGFKIELNDMHGKIKSQATYPESDPDHPITYTKNFYKVENESSEAKKLSNNVTVINAKGEIDTTGIIGKDIEVMADMRQQISISNGSNYNVNGDFFTFAVPPFFLIPSLIGLAQREENQFRSVATTKVIQRYGILDSIVHIEKGSLVSTKNLLYDSETGDVLLTRTQNEFNDSLYNFSYPSHWAYDGMGMAYKNIDATAYNVTIKDGKIIKGLPAGRDTVLFASGDEILAASKQKTGGTDCANIYATFPNYSKIWAVNANEAIGGTKEIYFIDKNGKSFNGNDISLKVTRSGRKNMNSQVGTVTTLKNPLVKSGSNYQLNLNNDSKVLNASAVEYKQFWKAPASCNTCPDNICFKDTAAILLKDTTFKVCWNPVDYLDYTQYGSWIYSSFTPYTNYTSGFNRTQIVSNPFWIETGGYSGPLNRCAIWLCDTPTNGTYKPVDQWVGFSDTFSVTSSGTVYIGLGADNGIRVYIDGTLFREDTKFEADGSDNFKIWHILPKFLTAGLHTIKIDAQNSGSVAGFGLEIYANTEAQIRSATSYIPLNVLFSTRNKYGKTYPAGTSYGCPEGYSLDSSTGTNICRKIIEPLSNPYQSNIVGNWKQFKSYTYYSTRGESNPTQQTDIRRNGSFKD
ncbi:MAG TPA: hypothetical protein VF622_03885, partial [Segetibacter sp.]